VQITLAAIDTYESAGLIHQMATLNATKLLLLTNQTDPNRNTNPNRHSNGNIFTCISLTPINRLYRINERNFSRRRVAGFVGGPVFYPFADVAVLRSERMMLYTRPTGGDALQLGR